MSEIARVRDSEGRVHHSARESKFVQDGLNDGSLVDLDKEVPSAPADAPNGDDLNARSGDGGSGKRERASRTAHSGDKPSVVEPEAGS